MGFTFDQRTFIVTLLVKMLLFLFLTLDKEVQQERPEYSLPEFLSDIGGTFGLFLGISIASIVVQVF